jgi:Domain of unknown function (DUF4114)/PEP-CTERM motif
MNAKFLTGLLATAAALSGVVAQAAPAAAKVAPAAAPAAFNWDNSWTQSKLLSPSATGFDYTPFQAFIQPERIEKTNASHFVLDSSALKLKYSYDVKTFFIGEGAGYKNQLAFQATGKTNSTGLIFNDISNPWESGGMAFGSGASLGTIKAGSQLDFWLRADGYNRGSNANIFGTKTASNEDGLQHVFAATFNKKYLVLGFEDLYGKLNATGGKNEYSDRDFNDAVVAVDIGEKNVNALNSGATSVPEPSITLGLLGLGAAGLNRLRRQKGAVS